MRFATLVVLVTLLVPARAQPVVLQTDRVVPAAGADGGDNLGEVVVLDGHLAVVASSTDAVGPVAEAGSVTVFAYDGSGWQPVTRLVSPAPVQGGGGFYGGNFGSAVAMDGTRIVVGAPYDAPDTGRGAVYVFDQTEPAVWTLSATLSDQDPGGLFGVAVGVSGSTILASSRPFTSDLDGHAHIFERTDGAWAETAELVPSAVEYGYGERVALDGDVAVVSENRLGDTAAFVFERGGGAWTEKARLAPFTEGRTPSLSLDGMQLAFGLGGSSEAGAVVIYERTTVGWTADATLTSSTDLHFGESVALDGDQLAVGASFTNSFGSVVLFERSGGTWTRVSTLTEPDTRDFGTAVAMDGGRVLVGAPDTDVDRQRTAGVALVFEASGGSAWSKTADLRLGVGRDHERFGSSVALSGGRLAASGAETTSIYGLDAENGPPVFAPEIRLRTGFNDRVGTVALSGSHLINADSDRVTTLRRTPAGWQAGPVITTTDAVATSVALDGDRALIGRGSASGGAATVYEFDGDRWRSAADLIRPVVDLPRYGRAVALDGGRALVASQPSRSEGLFGRVDVFEFDGTSWVAVRALEASGGVFGQSVALSGGRAAVGAPDTVGPPGTVETASVFGGTSWNRLDLFEGVGPRMSFGASIALDGDRMVVGAPASDVDGQDSGAAYVYEFDGAAWSEPTLIRPDVPSRSFGASVAIEGRRIAVGAPRENVDAPDGGAVYLFQASTTVASDRTLEASTDWLSAPYPNPTAGGASLSVQIAAPSSITVRVADMLGRVVQTSERFVPAGRHTLSLGGLSAGSYVVLVTRADGRQAARRLAVVR